MKIKIGYWLIESDEAKALWDELLARWEKGNKDIAELVESLGGEDAAGHYGSSVAGIKFKSDPGKPWRKSKYYGKDIYVPDKRLKAGKELSKRMRAVRIADQTKDVGNIFLGAGQLWIGGFIRAGFEYIGDLVVVGAKIPSQDNKEQWEPIKCLRSLKSSEYWAMKEAAEDSKGR